MPVWNNSRMTTLHYSSEPSSQLDCIVKIEDEEILVGYTDGGFCQYKGKSNGEGHFVLQAAGFNGRATLHMFKESSILEGSWEEDGSRGMWRIELHKSQD